MEKAKKYLDKQFAIHFRGDRSDLETIDKAVRIAYLEGMIVCRTTNPSDDEFTRLQAEFLILTNKEIV